MADTNSLTSEPVDPWFVAAQPGPLNYTDGCGRGQTIAASLLQWLKRSDGSRGYGVTWTVVALAERLQKAESDGERAGVSGEMVGLCGELSAWLYFAVNRGTGPALKLTEAEISAQLAAAMTGGPTRRLGTLIKQAAAERSAARRAARANHV